MRIQPYLDTWLRITRLTQDLFCHTMNNKAGTYFAYYYNTRHEIRPDFIQIHTTTKSPYPRYRALTMAKAEKEGAKVGTSLQSYTPPARRPPPH